jgi:hypothetical protein
VPLVLQPQPRPLLLLLLLLALRAQPLRAVGTHVLEPSQNRVGTKLAKQPVRKR